MSDPASVAVYALAGALVELVRSRRLHRDVARLHRWCTDLAHALHRTPPEPLEARANDTRRR